MGADGSKVVVDASDPQQILMIRELGDLFKCIAEQDEANRRQRQMLIEQIFKMIMVLMRKSTTETVVREEHTEINIEGVTYEILQLVNRGSFGVVYKAKTKGTDKMVAIKVMQNLPGLQRSITNEINFLRVIKEIPIENHPIIEYYASKLTDRGIFIGMELAESTLLTFWSNIIEGGDSQEIVLYGVIIMAYVLRALAFLEKLNIIHGDIKPQNLVVVATKDAFCIKLIDFGTMEKMSTQCVQMTVDEATAYTLYFVSPEFLRRNANNVMSRHLHKKSDAWAAGVMFYVLFFQQLPWKDQQAYESFCNDPDAKDIVVPDIAGFKMIIELLLMKNPDKRSSATETLMQLKDHPIFQNLVQSLNQSFCPVDDVCHMTVPDNVRQELLKLGRSTRVASTDSKGPPKIAGEGKPTEIAEPRQSCRYGEKCYSKETNHRRQWAHPGDSDYHATEKLSPSKSVRPPCRYGTDCSSKDAEHLKKYAHPSNSHNLTKKPPCRYGKACYNMDSDHRKNFTHPNGTIDQQDSKQRCRYGANCNKMGDQDHAKLYLHQ